MRVPKGAAPANHPAREPRMRRGERGPLLRVLLRIAYRRAAGRAVPRELSAELAQRIDRLAPVARDDLPRLLEASGLGALVHRDLPPGLPPSLVAAVDDLVARTRARGRRLAIERAIVADALFKVGVDALPLKGAWLAEALYARPECRPMADTDLFVGAAQWHRAGAALQDVGYALHARTWKHEVWLRPDNRMVVDERGEHEDNPRPVELHPRLGEAFRGLALELPPRHGAARGLHVLAHATVDMLARRLRPVSLVDVALWAGQLDDAGWRELTAFGANASIARFLWPSLRLAGREVAVPLPDPPMALLERHVKPALIRWTEGLDADAVSREARSDVERTLLEINRIWPLDVGEGLRVLRAQLLPGRWQLADRDPELARRWWWPWATVAHVAGLPALALRRWRQRPAGRGLDSRRRARRAKDAGRRDAAQR